MKVISTNKIENKSDGFITFKTLRELLHDPSLALARLLSISYVFIWNRGKSMRKKSREIKHFWRVQGSKLFSFLGWGIKIPGKNVESVMKKIYLVTIPPLGSTILKYIINQGGQYTTRDI